MLHNCTAQRLEKLKTQMSFRLDEGHGKCMYRIGVEDDGCHSLLDYDSCAETAKLLEFLARSLNAVVLERTMIQNEVTWSDADHKAVPVPNGETAIKVLEPSLLGDGRENIPGHEQHEREEKCADEESTLQKSSSTQELDKENAYTRVELTIQRIETHLLDPSPTVKDNAQPRKLSTTMPSSPIKKSNGESLSVSETLSSRNIRVAVVGNVDAGKSTMIGTLTTSFLDDGRGSSRTSIMKHRHEIESGRTSTATTHLMGFRSTGEAIAGRDSVRANRRKSEDEVARESYRIITLMDLAGHEKYLKTT